MATKVFGVKKEELKTGLKKEERMKEKEKNNDREKKGEIDR